MSAKREYDDVFNDDGHVPPRCPRRFVEVPKTYVESYYDEAIRRRFILFCP
jgi:hypothetical protein